MQWSPFVHTQFLSSSKDKSVIIWDVKKELEDDAAVFYHMGHELAVQDACWSTETNYLIASVGDDNFLNIWEIAHPLTNGWQDDIKDTVSCVFTNK